MPRYPIYKRSIDSMQSSNLQTSNLQNINLQSSNLQIIKSYLLRNTNYFDQDVIGIIAEFYYCPRIITMFQNNKLVHRFLGNVHSTEGENDDELDEPSSLPIHMFANMFERSMEFIASGSELTIQDWYSCDSNRLRFDSAICDVFASGNYTLVATDASGRSRDFRFQAHLLDTRDVSNANIVSVLNVPNGEIVAFMHDEHIITKRSNQLYIYDMNFNMVSTIRFPDTMGTVALINDRIIVQGSRDVGDVLHFTYYILDIEDITLTRILSSDVNEGDSQITLPPQSSDDEDSEDDEEEEVEADVAGVPAEVEPANAEAPPAEVEPANAEAPPAVVEPANAEAPPAVVEQRDPNDISHYFVDDEEYYRDDSELGKRKTRE